MTHPVTAPAPARRTDGPLLRWYLSYGSFTVPQAAAPIAFALIALPLTGDAASGAAMMTVMTLAQVVGAVPVTRIGQRFDRIRFLRTLIGLRTLALAAIAVLAGIGAPFELVVAAAAAAGVVNGAAFGHLRAVLNHLVPAGRLPRALGITATLNEVVFAAAPVLASVLGALSPQAAAWAMVVLGVGPVLLLPQVHEGCSVDGETSRTAKLQVTPMIAVWLLCAASSSAAIAAIEIGAVSMAVDFGLEPSWGVLFPLALCLTSITGGIWVSVRNAMPRRRTVLAWLMVMALGVLSVMAGHSVAATLVGALLVGLVLAPLATYYQLVLDRLVVPEQRAEVFALLRTANALGIITSSALISLASLTATFSVVLALMSMAILVIGCVFAAARLHARRLRRERGRTEDAPRRERIDVH
ncbi:MFS transporter [Brachybacterium halotolerans subsp. kimchii]|uniref:MFS transporter n=1 Tax=Brachybacterium halotolerans TaxID=2795215 RepID=UPI001E446F6F|nr:MFS transporter [Brachybacterium halotolerans]UEJ81914.1 MFS transporter [Brachybacterium halotolerans subsp. kimchii]